MYLEAKKHSTLHDFIAQNTFSETNHILEYILSFLSIEFYIRDTNYKSFIDFINKQKVTIFKINKGEINDKIKIPYFLICIILSI